MAWHPGCRREGRDAAHRFELSRTPGVFALVTDVRAVRGRLEGLRASVGDLQAQVDELIRVLDTLPTAPERPQRETPPAVVDGRESGEYLSIRELAQRIPYAEQTIRNLMTLGVFRLGEHYIKPRSRVMFRWSQVRTWLEQQGAR